MLILCKILSAYRLSHDAWSFCRRRERNRIRALTRARARSTSRRAGAYCGPTVVPPRQ